MNDYSKIIDHPHYQSKKRHQMSMLSRAAQFSPFAALSGYEEAVCETQRLTSERIILDEDAIEELDRKLRSVGDEVVIITYFMPDQTKSGGTYLPVTGIVKKIDLYERRVYMEDGTLIPIDDIFDIEKE